MAKTNTITVDAVYVNDSRSGNFHVFHMVDADKTVVGNIYIAANGDAPPANLKVNLLTRTSKKWKPGITELKDRARPGSKQLRKLERAEVNRDPWS